MPEIATERTSGPDALPDASVVRPGLTAICSLFKIRRAFTAMSKNNEPRKTIYRRSDNGQLTTKRYAENHPKTTEKERVRVGKK